MSKIAGARLTTAEIARNFREIRVPMDDAEALAEAARCFYCSYDAACLRGCPTQIDIPRFLRQIAEGDPKGAARTILTDNVLGAVCARVCPVDTLCEALCIADTIHLRPIPIGRLQRFATDRLLASRELPFTRAPETGRRFAIVGAGPAGIAAAFELARRGHTAVVHDRESEAGGLERFGVAEYKIDAAFVQDELAYLLQLGGVELRLGQLVDAAALATLRATHDAVLLAVGLGGTRRLGLPGESLAGVVDALGFIREVKTRPLVEVPVGARVVVVGGGNTAVDAATQAKRLGATSVVIAYRGPRDAVKCTPHELRLAEDDGCTWRFLLQPVEVLGEDGAVTALRCRHAETGALEDLPCDQLVVAIGQEAHPWAAALPGLAVNPSGTLRVDPITWMTSEAGVFAAGDCVDRAKEVVNAVREGKAAALAMDAYSSTSQRPFTHTSPSPQAVLSRHEKASAQ